MVPTINANAHNVGFLGVVPEHRGRGCVDDLLGECTRLLVEHGATRIVGGTDLTNTPMAAAFQRAGYTESERIRLDLVGAREGPADRSASHGRLSPRR